MRFGNSLCVLNDFGQPICDSDGYQIHECMHETSSAEDSTPLNPSSQRGEISGPTVPWYSWPLLLKLIT